MKRYLLTDVAEEDIDEIAVYIAQDNVTAALKLVDSFHEAMAMLAKHPQMGHSRKDLTDQPVRFWPVKSHLIIYKETTPIEIIRVLSGFRNIAELLI